ncbi:MAG: Asp-tRNA(Asn)/Glu-tRNA(Gln) amidotransferase subunit GatA [Helicobacteraceae bacterium]
MITLKEALSLSKDEKTQLAQDLAQKIDSAREIGAYVEQLKGEQVQPPKGAVPILIKDNIAVKGQDLTCCSKILQGYKSPYDATVIEKLRLAGLEPMGRANMDEFAMGSSTETSFYGKTLNPHNHSCVPGGSSGGSAAAVAAGLAIAALGSDTGGSIRQPAAFCGCVGMKPTYSRVSRYGLTAFSSSLDQIGPITQTVEDAAILYDMLAGWDPKDATSSDLAAAPVAARLDPARKLKVIVPQNFIDECSSDVKVALENAVGALESAGHTVIRRAMSNTKYHVAVYYILATAEASANLARFDGVRYGSRASGENLKQMYFDTRSQGFGDEVKRRILLGTFVLSSGYFDAYYKKASRVRSLIKKEYEELFSQADAIFAPVTPSVAFEFGAKSTPLEMYLNDIFTISVNLAGLPAISLPIGKGAGGLPIGGQIITRAFDEQTLFDLALSLEKTIKEGR